MRFHLKVFIGIWLLKSSIVFVVMRYAWSWFTTSEVDIHQNQFIEGCAVNEAYLNAQLPINNSSAKLNGIICRETLELTFLSSGIIYLNATAVSIAEHRSNQSIDCQVRTFDLSESMQLAYTQWETVPSNGLETVSIYNEIVCRDSAKAIVHDNVHIKLPAFASDKGSSENQGMLVIDSLSLLSFKFNFPLSYKILIESFGAVEFKLHHKVADNSFANIFPMLTGYRLNKQQTNMRDQFIRKFGKDSPENWPLIWKNFKQLGYRTHFDMEDKPIWYLNSWETVGLNYEDLDFRMWPVYKHLWNDNSRSWQKRCIGNRTVLQFQLDTLKSFLHANLHQPYFFYYHISELTHDGELHFPQVDSSLHQWLSSLDHTRANSFLFVMSDHGPRYSDRVQTTMGYYEERLPLLLIVPPKQFRDSHSNLYPNLVKNSVRLTSQFDIHRTLNHLLSIQSAKLKNADSDTDLNGLSLFSQIPPNRTCFDAGVPEIFCTCAGLTAVDITDEKVVTSALAYVKFLNRLLQPVQEKCEELRLLKILYAYTLDKRSVSRNADQANEENYLLEISTSPNNAIYRTEAKHLSKHFTFPETTLRLNAYKKQSWCVKDSQELKKLCYCRHQ